MSSPALLARRAQRKEIDLDNGNDQSERQRASEGLADISRSMGRCNLHRIL